MIHEIKNEIRQIIKQNPQLEEVENAIFEVQEVRYNPFKEVKKALSGYEFI